MKNIKPMSVAGTFYSKIQTDLKNQIEDFAKNNKNKYKLPARAVIVPHAGLVYSGRLAYEGISQLDKNLKTLIIFAPAHKAGFEEIALSGYDSWQTPLGEIEVNNEINSELTEKFNAKYNDYALQYEHSIEIQVPIIQSIFENVKIVPVLTGKTAPQKVAEIINNYYRNTRIGFIISSDLSHFHEDNKARKIDRITAQMIETNTVDNFTHEQACGATGIIGLMMFAAKNNYSLIRIDMTNSGAVSGEKSSVVGYGCWFLYEGDKNEFIKKYYSEFVLDLCKTVITSRLDNKNISLTYPQVFDEHGACFVTLEKNNNLRGCIGSIIAHRPLIEDIVNNSQNAAFGDFRFNPVSKEEVNDLQIAVSLLTDPKPMEFTNEENLLNKIKPFNDGIIIKDKNYQAVYLPSVWEQLPDKKEFLNSLKIKAGLSPEYFSKTFEVYKFETVYIK